LIYRFNVVSATADFSSEQSLSACKASLNEILEMLQTFNSDSEDVKRNKLRELVGHTPLQVLCGSLLGLGVAILFR